MNKYDFFANDYECLARAKATGSVPVIFHFAPPRARTHTHTYNKYLERRCEIEIFQNGEGKDMRVRG